MAPRVLLVCLALVPASCSNRPAAVLDAAGTADASPLPAREVAPTRDAVATREATPAVPSRTTRVVLRCNLDAAAATSTFAASAAAATSAFAVALTLHDTNGQARPATLHFARTGPGSFTWHVLVDGAEITGGTAGSPIVVAEGTLGFDAQGALASSTTLHADIDFAGAVQNQFVQFDFGAPAAQGSTSLPSPSVLLFLARDGRACTD